VRDKVHLSSFVLQMKERVEKYMKFARENDLKRRRAIKRFQRECCEKEEKMSELSQLEEFLKQLLQRY
jgi:Domain of unknown function (DUF4200)